MPKIPASNLSPFQAHVKAWEKCTKCSLCQGRNQVVFARGKIPCEVLFIGEAPGKSENILGAPFVGPAGSLLDMIIERALEQSEKPKLRIALTNLVACIPKSDNDEKLPEPPKEAIEACSPRLKQFVRLCKPRLIILTGQLPRKHISGEAQFGCDWLPRGQSLEFCELTHPAAILRMQPVKKSFETKRAIVILSQAFRNLKC